MRIHQKYATEIIFPVVSSQAANTRQTLVLGKILKAILTRYGNSGQTRNLLTTSFRQTKQLDLKYITGWP